ncbi:MAG: B12-binding domain-containing radical SAM protein [Spirochaetes bacterium]|nr:B12-binding domain-containing radical SAM protein [Spirochaetota bacterium]
MRGCFINPPIEDFYATTIRRQPLGLLYIMSSLRAAGFEVELVNGHSPKKQIMPLPGEFYYLKKYMENSDAALRFPFRHYCHFGLSFQEIERRIRLSDTDIFFVPSHFTTYHRETEAVIELVKKTRPGAPIVTGGCHATLYPEHHLRETGADFVVLGEGEESSVELMRRLSGGGDLSGVPNLAYRAAGGIIRTGRRCADDIGRLPFPAREFLAERDFRAYRKKMASMITSRGCPNRCSFCTVRTIWGDTYRTRSVDSVIAEIDECASRYNASMINFEDDNLFATRGRAVELLEALVRRRETTGMGLDLTAMNGVSIEQIDHDIVDLMVRAGFRELNISLMSHSTRLQSEQHRPFDSAHFGRIAAAARRLHMNTRAYFILGLPGQTREEIRETIAFLNSLDVAAYPSIYYNVNAPREEWMMQRSSAFFNETGELSRDDLMKLFNECLT